MKIHRAPGSLGCKEILFTALNKNIKHGLLPPTVIPSIWFHLSFVKELLISKALQWREEMWAKWYDREPRFNHYLGQNWRVTQKSSKSSLCPWTEFPDKRQRACLVHRSEKWCSSNGDICPREDDSNPAASPIREWQYGVLAGRPDRHQGRLLPSTVQGTQLEKRNWLVFLLAVSRRGIWNSRRCPCPLGPRSCALS